MTTGPRIMACLPIGSSRPPLPRPPAYRWSDSQVCFAVTRPCNLGLLQGCLADWSLLASRQALSRLHGGAALRTSRPLPQACQLLAARRVQGADPWLESLCPWRGGSADKGPQVPLVHAWVSLMPHAVAVAHSSVCALACLTGRLLVGFTEPKTFHSRRRFVPVRALLGFVQMPP